MKKEILVIHGGEAFDTYEQYLDFLREDELDLREVRSPRWKSRLAENLGDEYEVFTPQMPSPMNAKYAEWKIWFEKMIPQLGDGVILVGHSLGGIFLAKYLSEETFPKEIRATILVAAVYDEEDCEPLADFVLPASLKGFASQGGAIHLFHSTDDDVVPFSHLAKFERQLPEATPHVLDGRGHFLGEQFPEIVDLLRSL
jgi:predicted alpha/beta hydrolase family esterase